MEDTKAVKKLMDKLIYPNFGTYPWAPCRSMQDCAYCAVYKECCRTRNKKAKLEYERTSREMKEKWKKEDLRRARERRVIYG